MTVTLNAVSVDTELTVAQRDLPDLIPAETHYLGWPGSMQKLLKLIAPEINH